MGEFLFKSNRMMIQANRVPVLVLADYLLKLLPTSCVSCSRRTQLHLHRRKCRDDVRGVPFDTLRTSFVPKHLSHRNLRPFGRKERSLRATHFDYYFKVATWVIYLSKMSGFVLFFRNCPAIAAVVLGLIQCRIRAAE